MNDAEIAQALNKAIGSNLTEQNIVDWLEGGDSYDEADAAVKSYLGEGLYKAAEQMARMFGVLEAKLQGKNTVKIGGITFKNLQSRK